MSRNENSTSSDDGEQLFRYLGFLVILVVVTIVVFLVFDLLEPQLEEGLERIRSWISL